MQKYTIEVSVINGMECELWHPPQASAIAVICHPHSLHGGSMNNKVVTTIARLLVQHHCIVCRFNFRGVGASEGEFDEGIGESADLLQLFEWLDQKYPSKQRLLAGFSFGAYVSFRVCNQLNLDGLISVAPAVENFDFTPFQRPNCPWVILQGEQDEIVAAESVIAFANSQQPPPDVILFPATSHFFHGQLVAFREQLSTWIVDNLSI